MSWIYSIDTGEWNNNGSGNTYNYNIKNKWRSLVSMCEVIFGINNKPPQYHNAIIKFSVAEHRDWSCSKDNISWHQTDMENSIHFRVQIVHWIISVVLGTEES